MKFDTPEVLAELHRLYVCDPETGEMRRTTARGRYKAGQLAGGMSSRGRYLTLLVLGKYVALHRAVWAMTKGAWPVGEIDHINGIKIDNRLCNLRDGSHQLNVQNIRVPTSASSSGLLGAHCLNSRTKGTKKWGSSIALNGKSIHLGRFHTKEQAHTAYVEAKRRLHVGCTL